MFSRSEFDGRAGPTIREPPGDGQAINYFMMFYDDELLTKIVNWTNVNAERKRNEHPEKHKLTKGSAFKWYAVTLDELKAFFGVLMFVERYLIN